MYIYKYQLKIASYAQWDPQNIPLATNVYGGSTFTGGPGAIENSNEDLSIASSFPYQDSNIKDKNIDEV